LIPYCAMSQDVAGVTECLEMKTIQDDSHALSTVALACA
jgi:hypothetical protein